MKKKSPLSHNPPAFLIHLVRCDIPLLTILASPPSNRRTNEISIMFVHSPTIIGKPGIRCHSVTAECSECCISIHLHYSHSSHCPCVTPTIFLYLCSPTPSYMLFVRKHKRGIWHHCAFKMSVVQSRCGGNGGGRRQRITLFLTERA